MWLERPWNTHLSEENEGNIPPNSLLHPSNDSSKRPPLLWLEQVPLNRFSDCCPLWALTWNTETREMEQRLPDPFSYHFHLDRVVLILVNIRGLNNLKERQKKIWKTATIPDSCIASLKLKSFYKLFHRGQEVP